MTYWRYWQLDSAPFAGDIQQPLFRGATVDEALARIDFLVSNRRSLGIVLGDSGVGKSSVLRHCASYPPISPEAPNVRAHRFSALGLQGGELMSRLARDTLGSRYGVGRSTPENWDGICDYFRAASREELQTLILFDDAESASLDAQADMSRLLSMAFPLTIVLAVEADALAGLSQSLLERVELQVDLPAWEISQTAEFLAWSCQRVGRDQPIFTDRAVEAIQRVSRGLARRIVQVADLALVAGAVSQSDCVDADCVEQVICELPRTIAA